MHEVQRLGNFLLEFVNLIWSRFDELFLHLGMIDISPLVAIFVLRFATIGLDQLPGCIYVIFKNIYKNEQGAHV